LTEAGRPVAAKITAEIRAELDAIEHANPELRKLADDAKAALAEVKL
jgi:hypothetical protein